MPDFARGSRTSLAGPGHERGGHPLGAYVRATGSGALRRHWPLCRARSCHAHRRGHPDRVHPSLSSGLVLVVAIVLFALGAPRVSRPARRRGRRRPAVLLSSERGARRRRAGAVPPGGRGTRRRHAPRRWRCTSVQHLPARSPARLNRDLVGPERPCRDRAPARGLALLVGLGLRGLSAWASVSGAGDRARRHLCSRRRRRGSRRPAAAVHSWCACG